MIMKKTQLFILPLCFILLISCKEGNENEDANRIKELEDLVSELQTDLEICNSDYDELKGLYNELQDQVDDLEGRISELELNNF